MAEDQSLASTIDRTFLECGICFEPFNDSRGLPCLHAFCYGCLKDWALACSDDMSIMNCPLCKNVYQIPENGVQGFPVDFRVTNLRDTVDSQRQRKSRNQVCEKHFGQEKQYYCKTCSCTTCSECGLLDPTHTGHTFIRLKEAAKQKTESFQNLTKQIETANHLFSNAVQQTIRVKENLQHTVRKEEQAIDDVEEEFCQQLNIIVTNFKKIVQKVKEENMKQIELSEEILKTYQAKVGSIFDEASRIVEHGSDSDIISLYPPLADSLEQLFRCQPKAADNTLSQLEHVELASPVEYLGQLIEKLNMPISTYVRIQRRKSSTYLPTETLARTSNKPSNQRKPRKDIGNATSGPRYTDTTLRKEAKKQRTSSQIPLQSLKRTLPMPPQRSHVKPMSQKSWREFGHIKTKPNAEHPTGIAIDPNGDVLVTSLSNPVAVFSRDDKFKHIIQASPSFSLDIAITPGNQYIIPGKKALFTYDSQGQLINFTPTYDSNNQLSRPTSVAVDSRGRIIALLGNQGVFSHSHKTLSIHQPDETCISKFKTQSPPRRLTCTTDDNLIVSFDDNTLQVMDQLGHNATIILPPPDIELWAPVYVCCSKQGQLFVGNQGIPRAVYRYVGTEGRYKYHDCIARMPWIPQGIALSANKEELFVVNNWDSYIQIYR